MELGRSNTPLRSRKAAGSRRKTASAMGQPVANLWVATLLHIPITEYAQIGVAPHAQGLIAIFACISLAGEPISARVDCLPLGLIPVTRVDCCHCVFTGIRMYIPGGFL